ncbi:MAG: hypothetical protein JNG85_08375 [Spirochaetaceae bacterium]|nr:hypothetical protein [Spirochaetaceae bacterium]
MRIRYSPCKSNTETSVRASAGDCLEIDGTRYDFAAEGVRWPKVAEETQGAILEAFRDAQSELWITVRRFYSTSGRPVWDTGNYEEIKI